MADFLVYWKDYWQEIAEDPNAVDYYWHTRSKWFFDRAQRGDVLWVVVTAGEENPNEWRLIQRIIVRDKALNKAKHGPFEIVGDRRSSKEFWLERQRDLAAVLHRLTFASGKRITRKGRAIGNALQPIRPLSADDSALLNTWAQSLRKRSSVKVSSNPLTAQLKSGTRGNHDLSEFFRQASFYRYHPLFQEHEREYKIQLASALARARGFVTASSSEWLTALTNAINSEDDNIIYWEHKDAFLKWLKKESSTALNALRLLWNQKAGLKQRIESFSRTLTEMGLHQPGAQLSIISTLLMAISPLEFPPVKVESFSKAMKIAGWEGINKAKTALERYLIAQNFMDAMGRHAPNFEIELQDRLDVQGVVWCVSGGWPKHPVPPNWINDPKQRAKTEQEEYAKELEDLEGEPGARDLTPTEKLALVKARRGQGKFREDLVEYWAYCAVTACGHLGLLRASHIRPWHRCDNNQDRLNPFNGLLLSPTLDLAFDRGLITFEDTGRIKISKQLSGDDKKALGIHPGLRLCKVSKEHFPYLEYHRQKVFKVK